MRARYRKLSRSFDRDAYAGRVQHEMDEARRRALEARERPVGQVLDALDPDPLRRRGDGSLAAGAVEAVAGLVSTPAVVSAEEGEAELDELRQLIRDGTLGPEDLVDIGDGWTTIRACVPLSELADEVQGQGDVARALVIIGLLVGGVVLVLAVLSALAS